MMSLGVQPDEMGAILSALTADARFDAEQIRVGAVDAFSHRYTNLRDYDFTGTADCEQVLARGVLGAVLTFGFLLRAVDAAAHEHMRMGAMIGFNLLQTFIHPVDTVFTIDHKSILA